MTKKVHLVDGNVPFEQSLSESLGIWGTVFGLVLLLGLVHVLGWDNEDTHYLNNTYIFSAPDWLLPLMFIFNLATSVLSKSLIADRRARAWGMIGLTALSTVGVAFVASMLSLWIVRFYILDGLVAAIFGALLGTFLIDGRFAKAWRFIFDNQNSVGSRTGRLIALTACIGVLGLLAIAAVAYIGPGTHYESFPYIACYLLGVVLSPLALRPLQPVVSPV